MTGSRPLRSRPQPPRRPLDALRPAAFGADPGGERLARIRRSPHFADGAFVNPAGAGPDGPRPSPLSVLPAYLRKEGRAARTPAHPIPVHPTTVADLARPAASGLRLTWLGHSSVLAEIDGRRVLFDPVWSRRCSPFAFAGPRRLHRVPLPLAEVVPVDAVVVSHDHYDHLDMPTVRALARTGTLFVVPLGVGAHLEHWGVPAHRVTELDWHESTTAAGLTLTATPARHFCGRALRNSQHTLWASWVVAGPEHRIFHSGDTGYFPGFAGLGRRYGPFDATMVQVGAYSEFWPDVHMTPEEGMRAHVELRGALMMPIHWGTFVLAPHPWAEPAEGTLAAARRHGTRIAVPPPGLPFEPAAGLPLRTWWRAVAVRPADGPGESVEAVPPVTGRPQLPARVP
ncbi:MBL fold metallo-hydrolase [Streptomyces gamaensis]|uniref:MBL fold metallo-hydrolase n=1 Tax=Streptomyces gamaensis TaxID=1763542 RepID=A0ABW0YXL0_9ACTN